jgi:hypothetical protein
MPDWARVSTAPVMLSKPEKRMPKPTAMLPAALELRNWTPIIRTMPRIRARGAREEGWKIRSQLAPPEASRSSRRMI